MPFKVKNLMVSVLPQEADLQQAANQVQETVVYRTIPVTWTQPRTPTPLTPWTTPWTTTFTTTWPTGCLRSCGLTGTFSIACRGDLTDYIDPAVDINDIDVLTQLKVQLDAQINAVNANLAPQTVEQAEMLEKHLNEALAEVKATKDALRKASK